MVDYHLKSRCRFDRQGINLDLLLFVAAGDGAAPQDLSRIYSGVMNQIKVANGSAMKSPLLRKRYKNFDGISGKDDSKLYKLRRI